MGNKTSSKKNKSGSGNEEPQLFLERKVSPKLNIQVLWAKHMDFEFDCIVVPVNHPHFEIESLNRYLYKGLDDKLNSFLEKGADASEKGKFRHH
jgi:hypothetical protein